eukprot:maker-scaffold_6-snap-gene-7.11-mRNA-1 protein AED:0.22 eAED:0.22 QI:10/1/1/1/1/1/5/126/361
MKNTLIRIEKGRLDLYNTIQSGQCFNWSLISKTKDYVCFTGVLDQTALCLEQTYNQNFSTIKYTILNNKTQKKDIETHLLHYLTLSNPNTNLLHLYKKWNSCCPYFQSLSTQITGLAILSQPTFPTLISFILSSNNNIKRIRQLVQKLSVNYGTHLVDNLFSFPSLDQLINATEEELRDLGLGYRAKFIVASCKTLREKGGEEYLESLKKENGTSFEDCRSALQEFLGIGRKVADCVALFSLGFSNSVPVDTHMFQIVANRYKYWFEGIKAKSLTKEKHDAVQKGFEDLFGEYCGWATSVLFAAELYDFKTIVKPVAQTPVKKKIKLKRENQSSSPQKKDSKPLKSSLLKRNIFKRIKTEE